jgi:hypothetical protein
MDNEKLKKYGPFIPPRKLDFRKLQNLLMVELTPGDDSELVQRQGELIKRFWEAVIENVPGMHTILMDRMRSFGEHHDEFALMVTSMSMGMMIGYSLGILFPPDENDLKEWEEVADSAKSLKHRTKNEDGTCNDPNCAACKLRRILMKRGRVDRVIKPEGSA